MTHTMSNGTSLNYYYECIVSNAVIFPPMNRVCGLKRRVQGYVVSNSLLRLSRSFDYSWVCEGTVALRSISTQSFTLPVLCLLLSRRRQVGRWRRSVAWSLGWCWRCRALWTGCRSSAAETASRRWKRMTWLVDKIRTWTAQRPASAVATAGVPGSASRWALKAPLESKNRHTCVSFHRIIIIIIIIIIIYFATLQISTDKGKERKGRVFI